MPQAPNVQPFDVASGYSRLGQQLGGAAKNLGTAVETFNYVEKIKEDKAARIKLREQLIEKYNFKPEYIPEQASWDELSRVSHNVLQVDSIMDRAAQAHTAGIAERKQAGLAALADKEEFYKWLTKMDEVVSKDEEAQKKAGEQTGAAAILRDTSSMLQSGGFQGAPRVLPATPGTQTEITGQEANPAFDESKAPSMITNQPNLRTGTAATLATPEGAVDPTTLNPNRQEISQSIYDKKNMGKEVSSQEAEAELLRRLPNPDIAGSEALKSYRGSFRDQQVIDAELDAKKNGRKGSGGDKGEMTDNQYLTAYKDAAEKLNKLRSAAADKKELVKIKQDMAGLKESSTMPGVWRNIKGVTVDKQALEDRKAELEANIKETKGWSEATIQSEYDSLGKEVRRRGIAIGPQVKSPAPTTLSDSNGTASSTPEMEEAVKAKGFKDFADFFKQHPAKAIAMQERAGIK